MLEHQCSHDHGKNIMVILAYTIDGVLCTHA